MTDSSSPTNPQVRYGQPSSDRSIVPGFGWPGAVAGVAVVLLVLGGLVWAAAAGTSVSAQRPHLFGGYQVLEDDSHPFPVIDLATGNVTVRVAGVDADVRATGYQDVQAVPVDAGTMLVNRTDGTFNLLGTDNFVVDTAGGGVGLGPLPGLRGAAAVAAGSGAYIVRYASPRSTVSLVDEATVQSGAKLELSTAHGSGPRPVVTPRGFAALDGPVADQPGSAVAAASDGDLWVLVAHGSGCQVVQLHPVPTGHTGLLPTIRTTLATACPQAALAAEAGTVAVAWPGHVRLFLAGTTGAGVEEAVQTTSASGFLPVSGANADLWFLAHQPAGWSLFGVSPGGRVTRVSPLAHFGPQADPVAPVVSGNLLYTLDQNQPGQPTLWSIVASDGAMVPVTVRGSSSYPAAGRSEKALFTGTQLLVNGPRVIFNNPGSLEAVVVFTDGSHPPVVVDKNLAQQLSSTGPAVIAAQTGGTGADRARGARSATQPRSVPVVQAVSQAVTCATTTQKPYAPQITSIAPSSGSALISWSYQLLDVTDCEPDSWSVHVVALSGSHQPLQPTQVVNGQDQLQFTGLRPATTYQATVTAYINRQFTPSTPATFTTSPRGPDAPTAVHAAVDAAGDWVVSWTPCVSAKCVVPADVWNVVASACGSSYVPQPPSVQVAGTQDTVTLNAASLGLLGDSLSFSVNGQLSSGLAGNPTADGECTQSWRPPAATDISLSGAGTPAGQTVTAHLQVSTSSAVTPAEALGSLSTDYVHHVGPVTTLPATSPTATISGLAAGQTYVPSVTIYPAGHPAAAVTVTGHPFTVNLPWPLGSIANASFAVDANPNQGTATIPVPGYTALVRGQPYMSSGSYTCGNTQSPLPQMANGVISVPGIDLDGFSGTCTFSFALSDTAPNNPYGGVASQPVSGSFDATNPNPPNYTSSFSVSLVQDCILLYCPNAQIQVAYSGTGQPPAGDRWTVSTDSGGGGGAGPCTPTNSPVSSFPFTTPSLNCDGSQAAQVVVVVTYQYLGQQQTALNQTPSGTPGTTTTTTPTTIPTTTTTTTIATTTTTTGSGTAVASSRAASRFDRAASSRTELAAARARTGTVGDAGSRLTFGVTLVMLVVALFAGMTRRVPGRRRPRKGDS